ncbi:MAG: hypothetical protein WBX03_16310 [Terriglobales bacterium]
MGNSPVNNPDEAKTAKRTSGGRVEISVMKNDLEQLSASSNPAAAPQQ